MAGRETWGLELNEVFSMHEEMKYVFSSSNYACFILYSHSVQSKVSVKQCIGLCSFQPDKQQFGAVGTSY